MREFDDQAVIGRCLAGDDEAWRELVEEYQGVVYHVAHWIAKAAANDAAQETWLKVFCKLHQFHYRAEGPKFRDWLFKVARNTSITVARKRGLVVAPPDECKQHYEGGGPDELAACIGYKAIVREALAPIRPEYRNILKLYYLAGKSAKQVAEIADLKVETVEVYLCWGRKEVLVSLRRMGVYDVLANEFAEELNKRWPAPRRRRRYELSWLSPDRIREE